MAKNEKNEEQQAQAEPREDVVVELNPTTGLSGYAFSDGYSVRSGNRYVVDKEKYTEYSKVKHDGRQVLVKT